MHKDLHCSKHCREMCGTECNACTPEPKTHPLALQTQMELGATQQHVQHLTEDLKLKSTQMEQLLEHATSLDAEHIAHIQEAEEDLAVLSEVRPACSQSLHKPSEQCSKTKWQPRMRGPCRFLVNEQLLQQYTSQGEACSQQEG